MSPSWRDRVLIGLAPGRVELTRFARGLRPGAIRTASVPVETAGAGWENCLAALERSLAEPHWRGADAEVTLSSHFLRLHLLPWSEALATDDERLAYARVELEAIHGERVAGWTLRLDDAPVGTASPLCAVDTALLEGIRGACARAALKLRGVSPGFVRVFNRQRLLMRGRAGAFAFAEPGRVTVALLQDGACRWFANPRVGVALSEALAGEIRQAEALGAISVHGQLRVAFAGPREALPGRIGVWEVVPIATDPVAVPATDIGALRPTEP